MINHKKIFEENNNCLKKAKIPIVAIWALLCLSTSINAQPDPDLLTNDRFVDDLSESKHKELRNIYHRAEGIDLIYGINSWLSHSSNYWWHTSPAFYKRVSLTPALYHVFSNTSLFFIKVPGWSLLKIYSILIVSPKVMSVMPDELRGKDEFLGGVVKRGQGEIVAYEFYLREGLTVQEIIQTMVALQLDVIKRDFPASFSQAKAYVKENNLKVDNATMIPTTKDFDMKMLSSDEIREMVELIREKNDEMGRDALLSLFDQYNSDEEDMYAPYIIGNVVPALFYQYGFDAKVIRSVTRALEHGSYVTKLCILNEMVGSLHAKGAHVAYVLAKGKSHEYRDHIIAYIRGCISLLNSPGVNDVLIGKGLRAIHRHQRQLKNWKHKMDPQLQAEINLIVSKRDSRRIKDRESVLRKLLR